MFRQSTVFLFSLAVSYPMKIAASSLLNFYRKEENILPLFIFQRTRYLFLHLPLKGRDVQIVMCFFMPHFTLRRKDIFSQL